MVAGTPDTLDDFEKLMVPYGIAGLQRSGRIALPKLVGRTSAGGRAELAVGIA
jgi:acetolactate synthase small subunit